MLMQWLMPYLLIIIDIHRLVAHSLTSCVRNSNVHLTIEPAESSEGGVNGVRAVGGGHDDHMSPLLHAVHEGE